MKVMKIAAVLVAFLVLHFALDLSGINPSLRYGLVIFIAITLAVLLTLRGGGPESDA